MSDHKHDYKLEVWKSECDVCHSSAIIGSAKCEICGERIGPTEIERRLNATEALPAKKARTAASLIRGHTVKHLVAEYADILEDE